MLVCCAASVPAPALSSHPLIDPPAFEQARLSPDGRYLAYTVDTGFQDVLITANTADMKVLRTTRLPSPLSVGQFHWIGPNRLVFSTHTRIGSLPASNDIGTWQAIDVDGGQPRQLLSVKYTASRFHVVDPLHADPEAVLFAGNSSTGSQLFRMNTLTGQREILHTTPNTGCTYLLQSQTPRALICDGQQAKDEFSPIKTQYLIDPDQKAAANPIPIPSNPRLLHIDAAGTAYALDQAPSGDRFGTLDLKSGQFHPLASLPGQYLSHALKAGPDNTPFAAVFEATSPQVVHFSVSQHDSIRYRGLQDQFPGYIDYLDTTQDGRQILFSVSSDIDPGQLYLFNTVTQQSRLLLSKRPAIDPRQMASTQPITLTGRSGIPLTAYLTLPNSPAPTVPLIVVPHGGPWGSRDRWLFDPERQWLASLGYSVLQVNFRGSSGYGQAFQDAVFGQWATGVIDDILDATRNATSRFPIDPHRICLYGASFGAYAAMMAASRQPELFKCAAGQAGPYRPEITLSQSDIAQSTAGRNYLLRSLGSTPAERDKLDAIRSADRIRIPVFLAAGQSDVRTPAAHTQALAKALTDAGNPPTQLLLPDQGHGFQGEPARHAYYRQLQEFLARHLNL